MRGGRGIKGRGCWEETGCREEDRVENKLPSEQGQIVRRGLREIRQRSADEEGMRLCNCEASTTGVQDETAVWRQTKSKIKDLQLATGDGTIGRSHRTMVRSR